MSAAAISPAVPFQADFAAMAENLPEMAWIASPSGRIAWANRRWRDYVGTSLDKVGETKWESIHDPAHLPRVAAGWADVLRAGEPAEMTFPLRGADGIYRTFLTRVQPLRDESGVITCWFGINTNVAELDSTAIELQQQKRLLEILNRTAASVAAELNLERLVQMVTDVGVSLIGAQFGAFLYNIQTRDGGAYQLYTVSGVPREHFNKFPMPRPTAVFAPTFHGTGIVRSDDITKDPRYGKNAPFKGMPEGHLPVRSYLAAPVISRSGEVLGGLLFGHPDAGVFDASDEQLIVGVAAQAAIGIDNSRLYERAQREIEERKQAEEGRLVILRELNHRVKNLFAIAVGMVTMTARTSGTTEIMAQTLSGRLRALAHAHQLIRPTIASEDQKAMHTTVAVMADRILAPHVSNRELQLGLEGPEVSVGPNGATSLALVLHELATNAAKYGALSESKGQVSLAWRIEGRAMVLNWVERGGPAIEQPPQRKGFGADLAQMSAKGQLGGTIDYAWNPLGVEIELRVSLDRLAN
ncbi:MAG: HWE histidine kinase domain-containing protein [Hyphomonadaceae bacterium]|nr:HWE histidine kinase domain-containing protein [Hyphomonadaceae bacterium]